MRLCNVGFTTFTVSFSKSVVIEAKDDHFRTNVQEILFPHRDPTFVRVISSLGLEFELGVSPRFNM